MSHKNETAFELTLKTEMSNLIFAVEFLKAVPTPWGSSLTAFEVTVGPEGFLMGQLYYIEPPLSVSPESQVAPL